MIEVAPAPLQVALAPRQTLYLLEVWGDLAAVESRLGARLPSPCRALAFGPVRLSWWEPNIWLARGAPAEAGPVLDRLTAALGDHGAATEVSGGFARLRVEGPLWRDLLMIGGVFDAESPTFGAGCVAATVIHHLPVHLDVIDDQAVDAFTPSSYAADLLHHWTRSAARLRAG